MVFIFLLCPEQLHSFHSIFHYLYLTPLLNVKQDYKKYIIYSCKSGLRKNGGQI